MGIMFVDLEQAALVLVLALARVTPALLLVPLFGEKALASGLVRGAMMALVALALLPTYESSLEHVAQESLLPLVIKEATIGLVLGFSFGAPYFAALACGEILDNQRGATVAKAIDPAAGVEASILATLMGFMWTVTFALGGGVLRLLETLAASYQHLPLADDLVLNSATVMAVASLLGQALMAGILSAAPAFTAMLLIEIMLGVLSRFAPQLNPFSVAMTVKGVVACLVLALYFGEWTFDFMNSIVDVWPVHRLFPGST